MFPLLPHVLSNMTNGTIGDSNGTGKQRKSFINSILQPCHWKWRERQGTLVVEAAGVEPASEKALLGEPTYLVRSKVPTGSSERTRLNPSARLCVSLALRTEAWGPSRQMTLHAPMRACGRERLPDQAAYANEESLAVVVFPIVLRVLGTRYAFLSQIIPYQDSDLERLYAFVRNLLAKLPPPGDGHAFVLDDEVSLRFSDFSRCQMALSISRKARPIL